MVNRYKVKKYCCDDISQIQNYKEAVEDTDNMWALHHKMELIVTGAVCDATKQDLIDWNIYYDRPADELMFIKDSEHKKLHRKFQKQVFKNPELQKEHLRTLRLGKPACNRRRIKCIETGEIFDSLTAACKKYKGHIFEAANGTRKTASGYHWEWQS